MMGNGLGLKSKTPRTHEENEAFTGRAGPGWLIGV